MPLKAAFEYAARGWPVFPCIPDDGPQRKRPLTPHGLHDASTDQAIIVAWWHRWPGALIGVPTGRPSGCVVLDVDVKHSDRNGFDTLAAFAFAILPETPMVHTASGGLHLYFDPAGREIRNTEGKRGRGIGHGLDWRGDGGYVIAPSPGSGYVWDPHLNIDTVPLARVPERLLPAEKVRIVARPIRPIKGLSPYAEEALDRACKAIIGASNGEQEATINGEVFAIGTLAGAGGIPPDFARRVLIWAARQVQSYDHRRPWRPRELDDKVSRAFMAGLHQPRGVRRGRVGV
jgi:hypothetical protein